MTEPAIRDALTKLEDTEGRLTPEKVVAAARNPKSPLHSQFEWNDGKAAQEYRLDQARLLIRSIKVNITVEHRIMKIPKYVRDPEVEPAKQGYRTIQKLRGDADAARTAVVSEFTQAAARLRRARDIATALDEIALIDDLLDRLQRATAAFEGPAAGSA